MYLEISDVIFSPLNFTISVELILDPNFFMGILLTVITPASIYLSASLLLHIPELIDFIAFEIANV